MNRPASVIVTDHPLAGGYPPAWAAEWGQDVHGPFAQLTVAKATQRLRWIPAGWSVLGSPIDEPGRFDWEFKPRTVHIPRGFWMFDTPCTQAVWKAVMQRNPSRFDSPTRPVESVSWDDCQDFLGRLRMLLPGLDVDLPTEDQWEYACRAGTTEATYEGPIEILGENNAPVLNAIAWYGGNSGVEFELEKGVNANSWRERQFEFETAGTHPVARKLPNTWGLFDMLGNVYEWCQDEWVELNSRQPTTGDRTSARRVIRGGCWSSYARNVRAANRYWYPPVYRNGYLGFRCRVQ
ncbi:MAG: formylglycine-generating enzyme family protein [Pirellulaceae bacterium]|nr:formylglycine-generating enzyme family protein [Pirellulaceae bacterium]